MVLLWFLHTLYSSGAKLLSMAWTLDDVMEGLPEIRRHMVGARAEGLLAEVKGLRALRALAGCSQEQLADAVSIKQPSIHEIEREIDPRLSTLLRFVEAVAGTQEPRATLHGKGTRSRSPPWPRCTGGKWRCIATI